VMAPALYGPACAEAEGVGTVASGAYLSRRKPTPPSELAQVGGWEQNRPLLGAARGRCSALPGMHLPSQAGYSKGTLLPVVLQDLEAARKLWALSMEAVPMTDFLGPPVIHQKP
jgi:hypothetical protein